MMELGPIAHNHCEKRPAHRPALQGPAEVANHVGDSMSGGLIVSLVWILGQRLLVRFLIGPGYTAYGIVGSFIAVMIWVYYVSRHSLSARNSLPAFPPKASPTVLPHYNDDIPAAILND